jgi:hypothetical protein
MPMRVTGSRGLKTCVMPLLALFLIGCSSQISNQVATSPTPQTYVGPVTTGSAFTFSIDHSADTFSQNAFYATSGYESYVFTSGGFTPLPNGILNIGVTYGNGGLLGGDLYNPPQPINWALEWPGQGGFAGLKGQTVSPFAPNQACPGITTPQTFQFVTFPIASDSAGTAYGSVSIGTSGRTVNFANISQCSVLPTSTGACNAASDAYSKTSMTGTCGPTSYGQTISVPDTVTVTDPGTGQSSTPSATIAIGPSGFLVEGNGYSALTSPPTYLNILGGGLGAVGLPEPSSPLTASALVAAQYTGFIYSTGAPSLPSQNLGPVSPASLIASFGFPNLQTACPSLPAPQTSTIVYGGEFSNNDPSSSAYGNCDFAVDLGVQSAKSNGLFPNATVWVGSGFPGNRTGGSYSFAAVAIAGQLNGKFAIFLIGLDTAGLQRASRGQQSQDWGIYLLQSN